MIRDLDVRCPKGHRPSHNTFSKMLTQGIITKEPCTKEPKSKKIKLANGKTLALPYFNDSAKPNYQEKKKEHWQKNQE